MKTRLLTVAVSMIAGVALWKAGEALAGKRQTLAASSKTNCDSCDYSTPKQVTTISVNAALQMSRLYYENRLLGNNTGFDNANPDSRSVWFGLQTLKNFIWKIESEACKDSCLKNNELGVRIYFAEYPAANILANNPDYSGVNIAYARRHTIFMVPTFGLATSGSPIVDYDFNPWALNRKNGCQLLDSARNRHNTLIISPDPLIQTGILMPDINAMNHASMIPPGKPEGAVFIE